MEYSVIKCPVVLVLDMNDRVQEMSFRQVFEQAHLLKDISGDNPLDRFAMFRLLVAFAMDAYKPQTWRERKELFNQGCFDMKQFDEYVNQCEQNGACFDLLDAQKPFMQAAHDEELDRNALKSIAKLSPVLPQGNNHMFWLHQPEEVQCMTLTRAFRTMLGLYTFCTAMSQGYPSPVNNTTPVYTMVKGENLYQTIILNMLSIAECEPIDYGEGMVPWRKNSPIIPKQEVLDVTLLEALTWQPRRITLQCDNDYQVTSVWLQQGKNFKGNEVWADPWVPRKCTAKGDWITLKPQTQRALWRDLGTILLDTNGKKNRAPTTVTQCLKIMSTKPSLVKVYEIGLVTSNASFVDLMEDELSVPVYLLEDEDKASLFVEQVSLTENIQHNMGYMITHCIPNAQQLATVAQGYFLTIMHDALFGEIEAKLEETDTDNEESLSGYIDHAGKVLLDAVKKTLHDIIQNTGTTVQNMKYQIQIREKMMGYCYKLLKEREEEYGL